MTEWSSQVDRRCVREDTNELKKKSKDMGEGLGAPGSLEPCGLGIPDQHI